MRAFFLILLFIGFSQPCWGQYYPRGVRYNDNFLPNLDEPDKYMFLADGLIDIQKERNNTNTITYQSHRLHVSAFYGGKQVRGGLQVMQDDSSRDVKDVSFGLAFAFYRPLFFEVGAGYLQRFRVGTDEDGWALNAKAGYEYPLVLQVNYRLRIRVTLNLSHKTINGNQSDVDVVQFFPMVGLEFET